MKKTSNILSICALVVAAAALVLTFVSKSPKTKVAGSTESTAVAENTSGIAYFNLDEVVANYQMAIDLQQSFEKKPTESMMTSHAVAPNSKMKTRTSLTSLTKGLSPEAWLKSNTTIFKRKSPISSSSDSRSRMNWQRSSRLS